MSRQIETRYQSAVPTQVGQARRSAPKTRTAGYFLLWPVVAFWIGVAILFLGAAGAAGWQFASGMLRSRGNLGALGPIYAIWLLLSLFFFFSGLFSGVLAWLLAQRYTPGYYGSLLAAMGLLFLGPLVSIIPAEPDYLIVITMALLPTIIVLLTLGSGTAFERP